MYKTPIGLRMLRGAERRLVVESLIMISDSLALDDFVFDIPIIEDSTHNQKVVMYHAAARLLLTAEKPPPLAMAVLDATVASVYRAVREMIFMELDDEFRGFDEGEISAEPCWRELAIAAGREMGFEDVPSLDDRNFDDWDLLLDCLEGQVLGNNNWEMVEHLDAAPEVARQVKRELGIGEDYFVAIPRDPCDVEADGLLAELLLLTDQARWPSRPSSRDSDSDGSQYGR